MLVEQAFGLTLHTPTEVPVPHSRVLGFNSWQRILIPASGLSPQLLAAVLVMAGTRGLNKEGVLIFSPSLSHSVSASQKTNKQTKNTTKTP